MKITSDEIKIALLSYYRFKNQQISADEVGFMLGNTDISSLRKDDLLIEVEIKISKSDLWQGEAAKKQKHNIYKEPNNVQLESYFIPNYFFICVPTSLLDTAKEWVLTNNEKYGILEYKVGTLESSIFYKPEDHIYINKRAKPLHLISQPKVIDKIARRLSSVNINLKKDKKEIL